jgi:hypothetical protein
MKKSLSTITLIFLLIILSINAILGGIGLISDPSGKNLGFSTDMLDYGPFNNFFVPGLFLLIVFGVVPPIITYGLIKKPKNIFFEKINFYKEQHWSWSFSYYLGLLLIIWINIESIIIQKYSMLQFITSTIGVVIILLINLNKTKSDYKK